MIGRSKPAIWGRSPDLVAFVLTGAIGLVSAWIRRSGRRGSRSVWLADQRLHATLSLLSAATWPNSGSTSSRTADRRPARHPEGEDFERGPGRLSKATRQCRRALGGVERGSGQKVDNNGAPAGAVGLLPLALKGEGAPKGRHGGP